MKLSVSSSLFFSLLSILVLTGCSQIQLASHMVKKMDPQAKSQGSFKVGTPYKIKGRYYYPEEDYQLVETGIASWYGPNFHGKQTANGEIFDMYELTAAHRTLQMPSIVRVTNLENGRSLVVRINDRGPFARGRIIDLSKRSADLLGFKNQGTAKVRVEVLKNESLQVAEAAKRGLSTRGYEVAINNGKPIPKLPGYEPRRSPDFQTASLDRALSQSFENEPAHAVRPEPTLAQRYHNNFNVPVPAPTQTSHVNSTSTNAVSTPQTQQPLHLVTRSVQAEKLDTLIPGHEKGGNFYPDPIVTEMPVTQSDIFVQAGSFSQYDNAVRLSDRLSSLGQSFVKPVDINGRQFFRVRIGPLSSVQKADLVLSNLVSKGNKNAIIIVE